MRSKIAFVCVLLSATLALAQSIKLASISGVVVNSVTGAPLPRAHVSLALDSAGDRTYGAMTTAEGKFSITGMMPGSYALTLERVGFSMPAEDDAPENQPLVLPPDEKKDDLRLKLVPSGAISGRVTNAEGQPVPGVSIGALRPGEVSGRDKDATTDAKGLYRIGGLEPGRYRVHATPENLHTPPELRTDGTVDAQDAPTYHPAALAYRQSVPVEVAAGGETNGVDIQLGRVPIVAVSGEVEGIAAGAANVQLWIAQPGGGGRSSAGVKADGTFRLWRLFPGKYEISAMWEAPGGFDIQSAPVDLEVSGTNISKVNLRLIPPADITGRVEFQDDSARPPKDVPARLTLINAGVRGGATYADIAGDGSFHLTQLPAGRYRVSPSWNNVYITSMRLGNSSIDGSLLDLTNGTGGGELSVRASSATGSVSGNVTDDKGPAINARIALVRESDRDGVPPLIGRTSAGGRYSFDGVAPGKYKLVAVREADNYYLSQGARLDDYEELWDSLEIQPGQKLMHDLKRRAPDGK